MKHSHSHKAAEHPAVQKHHRAHQRPSRADLDANIAANIFLTELCDHWHECKTYTITLPSLTQTHHSSSFGQADCIPTPDFPIIFPIVFPEWFCYFEMISRPQNSGKDELLKALHTRTFLTYYVRIPPQCLSWGPWAHFQPMLPLLLCPLSRKLCGFFLQIYLGILH